MRHAAADDDPLDVVRQGQQLDPPADRATGLVDDGPRPVVAGIRGREYAFGRGAVDVRDPDLTGGLGDGRPRSDRLEAAVQPTGAGRAVPVDDHVPDLAREAGRAA